MPKRKRANHKSSNDNQHSNKKKSLVNKNLNDKTNQDDFLNNIRAVIDKRKQHLSDFYNAARNVRG